MIDLRTYHLPGLVQYKDKEDTTVIPEQARVEKRQERAACRETNTYQRNLCSSTGCIITAMGAQRKQ